MMKRIIKEHEPKELIEFKVENKKGDVQINYNSLGEKERTPLKKALLAEQGYLCAYTLKKISAETSHIEHIKPEELCRKLMKQGEDTVSDLDYLNMIACFPKELSGISRKKFYGAFKKDAWWESNGDDFISPLRHDCENHFRYHKDGSVSEITSKGKKTIDVLSLNHEILQHDRANAIDEFIYKDNKPLSRLQTLTAIETICLKNKDGFREFCIPIKHSLSSHLELLGKLKERNQHITKAKNKKP